MKNEKNKKKFVDFINTFIIKWSVFSNKKWHQFYCHDSYNFGLEFGLNKKGNLNSLFNNL